MNTIYKKSIKRISDTALFKNNFYNIKNVPIEKTEEKELKFVKYSVAEGKENLCLATHFRVA